MRWQAERIEDLFDKDGGINPAMFKDKVLEQVKQTTLIGVPEARLAIDFEPTDGSDILIRTIDPEKALGYQVHDGLDDYYKSLDRDLYVPQDSDFGRK
jgi:hypothetical protein